MAITLEMPDSVEGKSGNDISEPGVFQLSVMDVSESPTKDDGSLIPNAAFSADVAIVPGVNGAGKQKKIVFFNPDPSKGRESRAYQLELEKQRRFLEACNVVAERVEGGKEYTADVTKAKGQVCIMEFAIDTSEKNKGKGYIQLHFASIYHIDDPNPRAQCERNPDVLKLVHKQFRRDPKSFEKVKQNGSTTTNKAPANQPAGAGAGAAANHGVDMSTV